ncbi:MAG: rhodanese [Rickettsiales bacterium]|jgi:rhodanese-related sulfurtransferase|nr:rhodanese [Rickettsiales bacterium]
MKPCVAEYLKSVKSQINEVNVEQLKQSDLDGAIILDVREPQEHQQGMIPNATPLPRGVLEFKLFDLPELKDLSEAEAQNKPIYIYCASGGRSACAALTLQNLGFKQVASVAGGYQEWTKSGGEVSQ